MSLSSLWKCIDGCMKDVIVTISWLALPVMLACLLLAVPVVVGTGGLALPLVLACFAAAGVGAIVGGGLTCLIACIINEARMAIAES